MEILSKSVSYNYKFIKDGFVFFCKKTVNENGSKHFSIYDESGETITDQKIIEETKAITKF